MVCWLRDGLIPLLVLLSSGCSSKGLARRDAQPAIDVEASCVYQGTTYAPGEAFTVGCGSCSCLPSGAVKCFAGLCLVDSGPGEPDQQDASPLKGCSSADEGCLYNGEKLAVGESGVDGCRTLCGKLACAADACVAADAGVEVACSLPTWLKFGPYGGMDGDTSTIVDPSGALTLHLESRSCRSVLPACGTPCAITVATIAKDLADPEVQAALAEEVIPYGVSRTSVDVADYRISLGDGRSIQVGRPCCRFPDWPCDQPIPKGVQRLLNDLQAMVAAITDCR